MNLQNSISLPEHIGGHERNVSGLIMDEENKHGDLEEAVGDMKEPTPAIPDGGYGWVCVVCMLLFTANTWGINGVGICCKERDGQMLNSVTILGIRRLPCPLPSNKPISGDC